MTLHAYLKYNCKYCNTPFVPIPQSPMCPKCGSKADKVFSDFIKQTLESARFNLVKYDVFAPAAWWTGSVGDYYYLWAFYFFEYVSSKLKIERECVINWEFSKGKIKSLVSNFLKENNLCGFEPCRMAGIKTYLSLLLKRKSMLQSKSLAWLVR
ncbi:MAG: hypothetical protein PHQ86_05430 [Dehalococcoidales bacterium]|nr:hypothetical protein [Dehalococcoidales bacterium]